MARSTRRALALPSETSGAAEVVVDLRPRSERPAGAPADPMALLCDPPAAGRRNDSIFRACSSLRAQVYELP